MVVSEPDCGTRSGTSGLPSGKWRQPPDRWLVGAQRIRTIDGDWPAAGLTFRHVVGFRVLAVPGSTTVRVREPPRRLVLPAGMVPFGATRVAIVLSELSEEMTLLRVVGNPECGERSRAVAPRSCVCNGRLNPAPRAVEHQPPDRGSFEFCEQVRPLSVVPELRCRRHQSMEKEDQRIHVRAATRRDLLLHRVSGQ